MVQRLADNGILAISNVSSRVLDVIGVNDIGGAVTVGLAHYTTTAEVDQLVRALRPRGLSANPQRAEATFPDTSPEFSSSCAARAWSMGNSAPMIGRTRPSAIIGQTLATTAATISLLLPGPLDRTRPQRRCDHAGTLAEQLADVEFSLHAALHPDDDQSAVGGEGVDIAVEVGGAHDVEDHVGAPFDRAPARRNPRRGSRW